MNTLRCDILILGAGPAGMAAALSAAACDKQVIILDDNPAPGGKICRAGPQATQPALARRYRDAIAASAAIRVVNGARLIARPSAHSVLFETADGGGVVYWQKLILCCSAGGLQAVADTMNQAGGDVTNIIEQAPLPALAALRRRHKPRLPAGGIFEKRGDAGEPAVPLRGCALRRRGCRRRLAAGQTDPALRNGRLSGAHLRRQRPLAVLLAAAATERAAVPRPRGNAYCPRQAERRAVTATLLHHRARQGRQAQ